MSWIYINMGQKSLVRVKRLLQIGNCIRLRKLFKDKRKKNNKNNWNYKVKFCYIYGKRDRKGSDKNSEWIWDRRGGGGKVRENLKEIYSHKDQKLFEDAIWRKWFDIGFERGK